jgi:UPF0755 protein
MDLTSSKEKVKEIYTLYLNLWKEQRRTAVLAHLLLGLTIAFTLTYIGLFKAPSDFSEEALFSLEKGQTLSKVASLLEENDLIRSRFWFETIVVTLGGEENVQAGDYVFTKPQGAFRIARRLIKGEFNLSPRKITVQEGLNIFEIADLLESKLLSFDKKKFLSLAEKKEGYLFPDTYFFAPNVRADTVIETMENNFSQKIKEVEDKLEESEKTIEEVVTMASILETEARTKDSRRIISGILWKRLEEEMPLQVDVVFKYINGKNTYQLTREDLKTDSPYNTYLYKGLPPTPIANPGLDSILAALEPAETDYWYFMSDMRGNFYYSVTFEEHVMNKRLYLYN